MTFAPRPLPVEIQRLCLELDAENKLLFHLILVHDVAVDLCEGLRQKFHDLEFDEAAVCFGAGSHDIGKVKHPNELTGPGRQHEEDGPALLEEHGVEPRLAQFSRTHGRWTKEALPIEDLLVALSDAIWKGQRIDELEKQVIDTISRQTCVEEWEVFSELDGLLEKIASQGDERLAWQRSNG
ncbi:HD domain-containing protein [Gimesia sp.]|uniref:HD domain-containing protein n=1 Tax=Gimesia sp. TaxID=2024833 RepID=UPI0025C45DF8|nr:HD domain-containing protein [Gimesia sp.]|tara:strand:+ start:15353 stop:15898 length:546 start_codon:yes stop_codon:yes gene_type:complete